MVTIRLTYIYRGTWHELDRKQVPLETDSSSYYSCFEVLKYRPAIPGLFTVELLDKETNKFHPLD